MVAPLLGSAMVQGLGIRPALIGAGVVFGGYALRVRRIMS
jgi:hypothetical protein